MGWGLSQNLPTKPTKQKRSFNSTKAHPPVTITRRRTRTETRTRTRTITRRTRRRTRTTRTTRRRRKKKNNNKNNKNKSKNNNNNNDNQKLHIEKTQQNLRFCWSKTFKETTNHQKPGVAKAFGYFFTWRLRAMRAMRAMHQSRGLPEGRVRDGGVGGLWKGKS